MNWALYEYVEFCVIHDKADRSLFWFRNQETWLAPLCWFVYLSDNLFIEQIRDDLSRSSFHVKWNKSSDRNLDGVADICAQLF